MENKEIDNNTNIDHNQDETKGFNIRTFFVSIKKKFQDFFAKFKAKNADVDKDVLKKKSLSFGQKVFLVFTNRDLMVSISITLFMLIIFRILALIPLPGVSINNSNSEVSDSSTTDFISLFNLLGGGGLSQMSLFAVGVSPYITSQIIMQLLSTDIIPPLARLVKSGEIGRKKIELYTRLFTLPFAVAQSVGVVFLLRQANIIVISSNFLQMFFYIVMMCAGTYLAIFMGDTISKKGVGNGMSLIIMSGIVSSLPNNMILMFQKLSGTFVTATPELTTLIVCVVYILFFLFLLLSVVYVNLATRKIPVQQVGQGLVKDVEELPYLPIKVNSAGVIPVIFASSIMSIPITVAQFISQSSARWFIEDYLSLNSPVGLVIYSVLIILFVFLYSYIQMNPEQIADNFEKSHRFIPGVKPGYETERHISLVLTRINFIGAPFLTIIAVIPYVVSILFGVSSSISLGGTGIVIMVSVSLEFWNAIRSTYTTTSYQKLRKELLTANEEFNDSSSQVEDENKKSIDDSEMVSQLW